MGVILKLRDGTVKQYLFGRSDSGKKTRCGAYDCDHLECVIEERKAAGRGLRLALYLSPVGTLILLVLLYFSIYESETLLTIAGAVALIVLMEVGGFLVLRWVVQMNETQVRELTEFREKGTVNGISAEQVHET